ncbi:MAG: hypothetical protein A2912_02010 [Candidatus Buchananbacteria bacterium RIFCSPLOWO2_01_FULL_40_23b]|uniref:Uncharacterized protein n=1 Tax=Candidatus Buchananbacteria bacterium RIFCSPLOWO2_01_FULL_40_23b TaxID=1797544 RepID=A0A1G1YNJ7_9BACT|nr:MAG: hypothetical protein A2912_02010 [Candidatus Buchananbacteria bacterium RIFCSPLOWO2_01_FULL_40_23b]
MVLLAKVSDKDLVEVLVALQQAQSLRKNIGRDPLVVHEGTDRLTGRANRSQSELIEKRLAQINADLALQLEAAAKILKKK